MAEFTKWATAEQIRRGVIEADVEFKKSLYAGNVFIEVDADVPGLLLQPVDPPAPAVDFCPKCGAYWKCDCDAH